MRVTFIICSIFIAASVFGQTKSSKENSLVFTTGVGLRVTPVDLSDYIDPLPYLPFYVQRDGQISGPALYLGLLYYWTKSKISFEYSNSFRYHDYYLHSSDQTTHRYILTSDFHFTLGKFFPLRKNVLKAGIGYSFLNRGSNFVYEYEDVTFNGDTVSYSRVGHLNFSTFNFSIGYQVNQLSFELINRITDHKFPGSGPIYIPELRVSYGLPLKNKKIL